MTRSYVESELGTDPLPEANLFSDDIPVCASEGEGGFGVKKEGEGSDGNLTTWSGTTQHLLT